MTPRTSMTSRTSRTSLQRHLWRHAPQWCRVPLGRHYDVTMTSHTTMTSWTTTTSPEPTSLHWVWSGRVRSCRVGSNLGEVNLWPLTPVKPLTFDHGQTLDLWPRSNGVKPLTFDHGQTFDLWPSSNGVQPLTFDSVQTFDLWPWSNLWPLTMVKQRSNYDPEQDACQRVYKGATQVKRGCLLNKNSDEKKMFGGHLVFCANLISSVLLERLYQSGSSLVHLFIIKWHNRKKNVWRPSCF